MDKHLYEESVIFFIAADIVFTLPSHTVPAGDSCNTVSAAAQMALGTGVGIYFTSHSVSRTGRGGRGEYTSLPTPSRARDGGGGDGGGRGNILHFPLRLAHGGGIYFTSHSVSRMGGGYTSLPTQWRMQNVTDGWAWIKSRWA